MSRTTKLLIVICLTAAVGIVLRWEIISDFFGAWMVRMFGQ